MTVVAIHQPNFFPWLGYFDKMARADTFVFMDNVQFPKGSWVNRVRLLLNGEPVWVTMPVLRERAGRRWISDVMIDEAQPWRRKLLRSIELNYSRSPHFPVVFPLLKPLVENPARRLVDYNTDAIRAIAGHLGVRTPTCMGTAVGGEGQATELLVSMVQRTGGTAYLCGAGAADYQKDDDLRAAGIQVKTQDFAHPVYPQRGAAPFVPGLSVIDVLMGWGVESTRRFLGGTEADV